MDTTTYRVAGTIIAAAGGKAWDATDDRGLLTPAGEGFVFGLLASVPKGTYEFKVALNGSWDVSYGADGASYPGCPNMVVELPEPAHIGITFDTTTRCALVDAIEILPPGTPQHVRDQKSRESDQKRRKWEAKQMSLRQQVQEQAHREARGTPTRMTDSGSPLPDARIYAARSVTPSSPLAMVRGLQAELHDVALSDHDEDDESETPETPASVSTTTLVEAQPAAVQPTPEDSASSSSSACASLPPSPPHTSPGSAADTTTTQPASCWSSATETLKWLMRPLCGGGTSSEGQ